MFTRRLPAVHPPHGLQCLLESKPASVKRLADDRALQVCARSGGFGLNDQVSDRGDTTRSDDWRAGCRVDRPVELNIGASQ